MNAAIVKDGDLGFTGIDSRSNPMTLESGMVQAAENMRIERGVVKVRKGIARMGRLGNQWATNVYGSGLYISPSTQDEFIILVFGNSVRFVNTATMAETIYDLASGFTSKTIVDDDRPQLIQANNTIYITRGLDKWALLWDGTTLAEATTFPKTSVALYHQDRIFAATSADEIQISKYLDFTTWEALQVYKILKGGGDEIVAILPFQQSKAVIFGRRSVWLGFIATDPDTGALSSDSFLRCLTPQLGCVGASAVCSAGQFIFFLSDSGIMQLDPQLDLELLGNTEPLSSPIQNYIERINARHSWRSCAAFHNNRLYFAVPMDSDTEVDIASIVGAKGDAVLPFLLPYDGSGVRIGAWATITTSSPHGYAEGDTVEIKASNIMEYNVEFQIFNVSPTAFRITQTAINGTDTSCYSVARKCSTRNNAVLVYSLINKTWESIDLLPDGVYCDNWIAAFYGRERRLWLVSATVGICLYEERTEDDQSQLTGSPVLPFYPEARLIDAAVTTSPVKGKLVTRRYSMQSLDEKRFSMLTASIVMDEAGVARQTVNLYDPDATATISTLSRTAPGESDQTWRGRIARKGVSAEYQFETFGARPALRSVAMDATLPGREHTKE